MNSWQTDSTQPIGGLRSWRKRVLNEEKRKNLACRIRYRFHWSECSLSLTWQTLGYCPTKGQVKPETRRNVRSKWRTCFSNYRCKELSTFLLFLAFSRPSLSLSLHPYGILYYKGKLTRAHTYGTFFFNAVGQTTWKLLYVLIKNCLH